MLANLEIEILRALNLTFLPSLNFFFMLVDYSAYIFVFLLVCSLFRKKRKEKLVHLLLALAVGSLFILLLKYSIARDRPYVTYPDIEKINQFVKTDPSFPSFHTFLAFLSIYFIPKKPRWIKYLFLIYLLVLVPFSSLYMGTHYLSDVLIGALIGWAFPLIISKRRATKIANKI